MRDRGHLGGGRIGKTLMHSRGDDHPIAARREPRGSAPGRCLALLDDSPAIADVDQAASEPRGSVHVDDHHANCPTQRRPERQLRYPSITSRHFHFPAGETATQRGSPPLARSAAARAPLYSGETATQRGSPPTHETCRPRRLEPALISGTLRPWAVRERPNVGRARSRKFSSRSCVDEAASGPSGVSVSVSDHDRVRLRPGSGASAFTITSTTTTPIVSATRRA
jgi:hypothetical protein